MRRRARSAGTSRAWATVTGAVASAAAALALAAAPAAGAPVADPPGHGERFTRYVALGDSYAASPSTGVPTGAPVGCDRSANNYAHQVADRITPDEFVDVSCGGATTEDVFTAQWAGDGWNPPQQSALTERTTLVSLTIGGNDIGLMGMLRRCVTAEPGSRRCLANNDSVTKTVTARIENTAGKVLKVLTTIRQRSPKADTLLVGYPVVAPISGTGCVPQFPVGEVDAALLRDIQQQLNDTLRTVAKAGGATFIDTYAATRGHGVCSGPERYVEGLIPRSAAAALHPNLRGQTEFADQVGRALAQRS